jgi:hypothetical protein
MPRRLQSLLTAEKIISWSKADGLGFSFDNKVVLTMEASLDEWGAL